MDPKLKRIVEALLKSDGRSEAEAQIMRNKAARMLADRGLSIDDVMDQPDQGMMAEVTEASRLEAIVSRYVSVQLSRMTRTKAWMSNCYTKQGRRSDRKKFHFAGLREDVEWATWLLNHIVQFGITEAKAYPTGRAREDFLKAFAWRVSARMQEIADGMEEHIQSDGNSNALVVLNTAVDKFVQDLTGGLRTSRCRGSSIADRSAAKAGASAGNKVGFGRPISGGESVRLLK